MRVTWVVAVMRPALVLPAGLENCLPDAATRCAAARPASRQYSMPPSSRPSGGCAAGILQPFEPGRRISAMNQHTTAANRRADARRRGRVQISQSTYAALWASQGERCAICRRDDPGQGWRLNYSPAGSPRGILCAPCHERLCRVEAVQRLDLFPDAVAFAANPPAARLQ
ncbi:MAG: hypothetical protein DWQ37_05345 [Planctomycetota bacterium]|nr:MAG: hypothetical protein DWQ37_05345 [Planctomycetota bacterium]